MKRILQTKDENYIIIDDLKKEIQTWQSGVKNVERSLGESRMIAIELQSTANTKAAKILAEAEAIIASNNDSISHIEQDIATLHKELDIYSQIIQENGNTALASADSFSTTFSPKLLSIQNNSASFDEPASNSALITMKLVAFLNAKHYMVFGNKKGATHGHSWQFQVETAVSVQDSSFVKFEDLDRYINKLIAPYQRSVLNEVPPFDKIEPLTENIAALFFNQLEDDFQKFNVKLIKVTVWENPTKGIEITQRLPQYFSTGNSTVKPANAPPTTIEAENEVAATQEDKDEDINEVIENNKVDPEPQNDAEITLTYAESPIEAEQISTEEEVIVSPESTKEDVSEDKAIDPAVKEMSLDPLSQVESLNPDQTDDTHNKNTSLEYQTDRHYPVWQYILALLVITGVAVWAYWPILTAPINQIYPWGSDSWCHIFKADFYSQEILKGNYYPQFFPYWHNGVQPFRYWAPLPYFILAVINIFTHNAFIATNYYIFATALLGGLAMLVFNKRIGLVPAVCTAVVWVFWIDNVNVAFSSGNYPRLLAIALLPLLVEAFCRTVERKNKTVYFLFSVILIHLIVLSHAMIAAVYCVALMVFGFLWWLYGGISFKGLFYGGLGLVMGILSSSWWLIPSLTGGGTGFSSDAISANIQFLPFTTTLNPSFRFSEFYWGISLLIVLITVLLTWRNRSSWVKGLFTASILMLLLTLPLFKAIHGILPLHSFLWPFRFSSFWSLAFIICAFSYNTPYIVGIKSHKKIPTTVLVIVLLLIVSFDSFQSLRLLGNTTTLPEHMVACATSIEKNPGWRVATLDLSRLSSPPSYFLSEVSGREQVYGWAWQGAKTAQNIMLINMALENNWYPYIFQRLASLGTTDLMLYKEAIKSPTQFSNSAFEAGYIKRFDQGKISHWHSLNNPYLVVNQNQTLAIGKHASIYAMQLPTIEVGQSQKIDDYDLRELQSYQTIILAGSTWSSQSKSEELVRQYARSGGRVLVDLTGFPKDVFSRQPLFLGVYGEPIALTNSIDVTFKTGSIGLMPFAQDDWRCLAPQGLDKIDLTFSHYGNDAVLLGSKTVAPNVSVKFIGANLAYHTFLTHDPIAGKILQEALQLSGDYQKPSIVNIANYHTLTNGYSMSYYTEQDFQAIIPVAALDGMQTRVDEKDITTSIYENLILADLPAGQHTITLELKEAPIYVWSRYISLFSLLLIVAGLFAVQINIRKKTAFKNSYPCN